MSKINGKKNMVTRLISYLDGAGSKITLSVISAFFYSALSIAIPYFVGKAIDAIGGKGNVDMDAVVSNITLIIIFIVAGAIFQFFLFRININITYDVTLKIRDASYGKIRRLPVSFLDRVSHGNIQSMIISDCETVGDGIMLFLNQFASGVTSIILTLAIMLMIDIKTALIVIIFTPLSFIISYLIASSSFRSFKEQSKIRAEQTSLITEAAGNFRTVNAFNTGNIIIERFEKVNRKYRKVSSKATFLSSITNPSTRFVNALIYAGVAFTGAHIVMNGDLTVGALTSLLMYSTQFMKPFNDLSSVYTELSDSFACLSRIFSFLDEKELGEDLDADARERLPWNKDGDFEIEFRNVSFSYEGSGKKAVDNVSFKVGSGLSCAIVGPTGCGKTTLINLLLRFYEPSSGSITVNGIDIKDIPRNVLRSYLGVVSQDTWLSIGTVMSNIKFGNPMMDDEEAMERSRMSGADSFIRKFPQKYHEKIDPSRDDISEGQRQLLSITRAMAADPGILILDEATSSVDILTEVKIQKAVKELLEDRTSIIIAHRLSTIIDADMIVVMENGTISDIGKHEELVTKGGFYSKLYSSYIGENDTGDSDNE